MDYKDGFRIWYEQNVDSFISDGVTIARPIKQLPTKQEYMQDLFDAANQKALNYHR